jgi:hypothetical protein
MAYNLNERSSFAPPPVSLETVSAVGPPGGAPSAPRLSAATPVDLRAAQTRASAHRLLLPAHEALNGAVDAMRAVLLAGFEQAVVGTAAELGPLAEQMSARIHAEAARTAVAQSAREKAEEAARVARAEAEVLARTLQAERESRAKENAQLVQARRNVEETLVAERRTLRRAHQAYLTATAERDAARAQAATLERELAVERQRAAAAETTWAAREREHDAVRVAAQASSDGAVTQALLDEFRRTVSKDWEARMLEGAHHPLVFSDRPDAPLDQSSRT